MVASHFNDYNAFDLTHDDMLTCSMGKLIPCELLEVVPGDVFKWQDDVLVRLQPMLAPLMHRINVYVHYWYVPKRILQDDFEKYYTGGRDGQDSTQAPYITSPSGGFTVGSLADYFGFQTGVAGLKVSAFPFRAYAKIYNDWYRDQNLISEVAIDYGNGSDTTTSTSILNRAWGHGYFEDALPWTQRGPTVNMPSLGSIPVYGDGKALGLTNATNASGYYALVGGTNASSNSAISYTGFTTGTHAVGASLSHGSATGSQGFGVIDKQTAGNVGVTSGIYADGASAAAIPVPEVRQAFQTQVLFEIMARSGARFTETLSALFNVRISDSTVQRPLFLGGGKVGVSIGEILQTSSTDSTSPQGNMAGRGISAQRTPVWKKSFEEPGVIIGILNIRPKAVYAQGISRSWTRWTRFDEYLPPFAHLGMQGILNKEIFAQGPSVVDSNGDVVDEQVFGYTPMYDELRHIPSRVHGEFRSSLDYWSLWRKFTNLPQLNQTFIECDPDNRIWAVPTGDHFLVQIVHHVSALRRLPKFGTPGLIDHH